MVPSDPLYPKYATTDPASGSTLLTETLPACSGATINLTALETDGNDDGVDLTQITLRISVNGTEADFVDLDGTYDGGTLLPGGGGLTIVVGQ